MSDFNGFECFSITGAHTKDYQMVTKLVSALRNIEGMYIKMTNFFPHNN